MSKIKDDLTEEIKDNFEWIINVIRGRKDVKSRVNVILSPENLKTTSILTRSQAEFCSIASWMANEQRAWGDMFQGLDDYAKELKAHSLSVGGKGIESAIRLMASLSEAKILSKLGVTVGGEEKK